MKQSSNGDLNRNKILILKTHNQEGVASMWQLVQALDYALRFDIKIVNLSLAYWSPVNASSKPSIMEYIFDFAKTYKGTLFVAAAGNDSLNIDQPVLLSNGVQLKYYPAALPNDNLIVVAAGNCNNQLASFSNFGPQNVDIAAPGVDIYSLLLSGSYGYLSGTSMAAPHVSAAAALAASRQSVFDWKRVKFDLLNRTTPSTSLTGLVSSGRMLTFCDNYLPTSNPLLVTAKANKVLCVGGNTTLTATASGGVGAYSFLWSNGAIGSSVLITTPGSYTVTVTDANGNTALENINVFGASAPIARTSIQQVNCGDNCGIIEITNVVPGADYLWNNGSKKTAITICPSNTSTYSIITTTPNGCSSTSTFSVPPFQPKVVQFNDTTICPCTPVNFSAVATGGIGPLNYLWSPTSETTPSISVSLTNDENYSVLVTDSRGCTSSTSALISTSCFAPKALSATYNPTTLATRFLWSKGPCTINRTQLRWRCNSSSPWTIVTINNPSITSRDIVLPVGCVPQWQVRNRCCNNEVSPWVSPTPLRESVESTSAIELNNSIRVHPNPAGSTIQVEWEGVFEDDQLFIYNSVGQVVMEQFVSSIDNAASVDVSLLSSGLYFLRYGNTVISFSKQ
jgi:hypothetical protein